MLDDHPEGKPSAWPGGWGPRTARPRLSITVIDAYQGMGVGTRLMDALLALARTRGVRRIIADILAREHRHAHARQPLPGGRAAQAATRWWFANRIDV